MNYEHAYHAGSAADVFKHVIIVALLDFLTRKDKPLSYIDFYAGAGKYNLYDLVGKNAQEWQHGVLKLKDKPITHPYLQTYLKLAHDLHYYPGSPTLAKKLLRPDDTIILVEKADRICQKLKKNFPHDKQVHIHNMDAQTACKALLPPAIKRGLVLIDPPYEDIQELEKLPLFLKKCVLKFPTACYLLWYPIKSRIAITYFHEKLKNQLSPISEEILILECCPFPDDVPVRLNGSGLVLINPPFEFDLMLKKLMPELLSLLKQDEKAHQKVWRLK